MTEVTRIAKVLCRASEGGLSAKDALTEVILGVPNAPRATIEEALNTALAQLEPDLALDMFVMVSELEDEGDERCGP